MPSNCVSWIGLGSCFQAEWQVPTHVGRIAIGPGPFDAGPDGHGYSRSS